MTKIFIYVIVNIVMPNFIYKVRDKQGKVSAGSKEAQSEEELISKLQNDGLVVVSLTAEEIKSKKLPGLRQLHLRVTVDDLIIFGRQLATMLAAGVTLLKSLEVLSRQVESKALFGAVSQIKHDVATGSTFRDALAKHPKIFSEFWVNMVETGESSGTLPLSLTQLSDYLEVSASMRRKVTSALVYPAVLIVLSLAAMAIFTVWIIPIFARVFETLDVELPGITKAVIAFSNLARSYLILWLASIGAIVYLLRMYIQTEKGKWQLDQLKLRVPILAPLFQRIAIERFASGLATLIESGVPILYGLDIISKAVGNKVMERAIVQIRDSVRGGKGIAEPLEATGVFTPMVVQMVAVGEEIGELGKMLNKVSEFYQERIKTTLDRIGTLIEPVILVIMGIVIGILVISMFLPILQLALVR